MKAKNLLPALVGLLTQCNAVDLMFSLERMRPEADTNTLTTEHADVEVSRVPFGALWVDAPGFGFGDAIYNDAYQGIDELLAQLRQYLAAHDAVPVDDVIFEAIVHSEDMGYVKIKVST